MYLLQKRHAATVMCIVATLNQQLANHLVSSPSDVEIISESHRAPTLTDVQIG